MTVWDFWMMVRPDPRWALGSSLLVLSLACSSAWATQDEVALPIDTREALLFDQDDSEVRPLSGATGLIDVAAYPLGEGHHHWHGKVKGDIALLTRGDDLVWHASLAVETVADDQNEIDFRLVRLFYRFRVAVDFRLGPGMFWVALDHRCGHGTDGALPGRILIRSGIEAGYRVAMRWDALELALTAEAHGTILGQNTDLDSQMRGLFAVAGQVAYALPANFRVLAGVGLGAALVGQGPSDVYLVSDRARHLRAEPLPAAVVGVAYDGAAASLGVMLHFQRTLDTGLTETSQPASLLSLRIRFVW
jgi:hypothetical protein